MSSTPPGSEPGRHLDGDDARVDAPPAAEPTPEPTTDTGDVLHDEQAKVEPTAPDAEHVDRLEPPEAEPAAPEGPVEEAVFTGTTEDQHPDEASSVETDPEPPRSELDAAVERARTDHPPADETAVVVVDEPERHEDAPAVAGGAGAGAVAAASAPEAPSPPAPQTVYVQAPPAPRERGNRGFGILVGLIATVGFALLYAGVSYLVILGQNGAVDAGRILGQFVVQFVFWLPVVFFFLAFALLAAILNRSAWWTWAVFGLAVGVVVYFAYIAGALLTVNAWTMTPQQAGDFIRDRWLDPYAIIAAVVARELPIWFGGWIAAHGRTVTDRNIREREEYDRRIAAGPQPVSTAR
ncbi:hypothetical protein [Agromyces sp. SYSU T0242]|uniref:hypothetical protein n=1 Tax=Agromyces litoreus TaxID=3158561 RepID=UPI0033998FF8